MSLISSFSLNSDPADIAYSCITPVNISGTSSNRLMLVFRTNGCAYDLGKKGCTMCDFAAHAISRGALRVRTSHLLEQFESTTASLDFDRSGIAQIDLLTLGSFLHDWEVEPEFRTAVLTRLSANASVKKVVIESRAEYVADYELSRLRTILRADQILELGLGVETTNDAIRNITLHKNLPKAEMERVINCCVSSGVEFQAYLLLKPPGLSECAAIDDAVRSAREVASFCRSAGCRYRIALEPVFITERTPLGRAYAEGRYEIASLWSVVNVIILTSGLGIRFVGLSDENLSAGRTPRGCDACTGRLIASIQRFNGTQDETELSRLDCDCRRQWSARVAADSEHTPA